MKTENKNIIVDDKVFKKHVDLDYNLRIVNTTEKFKDFLNPEGWFNFKKLDERKELNIVIVTGVGTGKTYGCFNYYLTKQQNVAMITNTKQTAEANIIKLLDSLKLNSGKYNEWNIDNNVIVDDEGNKKVRSFSLRNYGNVKGARDYYAKIAVYDEFNQEAKQASISGQSATLALDTTINRITDRNNELKHIYYFANKDSPQPLLTTPILFDLGVYGINEFSEVFTVERQFMGDWIATTLVINQTFSENEINSTMAKWKKDPQKYKKEINQYFNGSANIAYFNKDVKNNWMLDKISLEPLFETKYKYVIFKENSFYEIRTDNINIWVKKVERPEKEIVYVINTKDIQENRRLLNQATYWAIYDAISKNKVLFGDVRTKYYWYNRK